MPAMKFQEVISIPAGAFVDAAKIDFGFTSQSVQLVFRTGTNPIFYSFDGSNIHGKLHNSAGYVKAQLLEPFRANQIWFGNGSGDEIVELTVLPIN